MSVRRLGTTPWAPRWDRLIGRTPLLQAQLDDSPAAAWPMDEASGTVAVDWSGNARHGTYTAITLGGASIAAGAGGSATFNGTSSLLEVPYGAWMNANSWTVEVLVYASTWSSGRTFAARDDGSSQRQFIFSVNNAGTADGVAWNTSGNIYATGGGSACATSTAYLMALSWDAASGKFTQWRNGSAWAQTNVTGNARTSTRQLQFGTFLGGQRFAGRMSNAAYYPTAVTSARLLAHAQAAGLA